MTKSHVCLHPDIKVINEKRDQSLPPLGSASNAARRGMIQNSPNTQWKVRSLKKSLLYASASMVITCKAAEGIVSMFESKVENPSLFKVSVRYACTGVAGI